MGSVWPAAGCHAKNIGGKLLEGYGDGEQGHADDYHPPSRGRRTSQTPRNMEPGTNLEDYEAELERLRRDVRELPANLERLTWLGDRIGEGRRFGECKP